MMKRSVFPGVAGEVQGEVSYEGTKTRRHEEGMKDGERACWRDG
jgi:hypothetical protein